MDSIEPFPGGEDGSGGTDRDGSGMGGTNGRSLRSSLRSGEDDRRWWGLPSPKAAMSEPLDGVGHSGQDVYFDNRVREVFAKGALGECYLSNGSCALTFPYLNP